MQDKQQSRWRRSPHVSSAMFAWIVPLPHKSFVLLVGWRSRSHCQQLHVEDQGCVRRDDCLVSRIAIGQFGRDAELSFAPDLHSRDPFIPSLDNLALSECETVGLIGVDSAVELLAVGEPSCVVDLDAISVVGDGAGTDLDVPVLEAGVGPYAVARNFGRSVSVWNANRSGSVRTRLRGE